METNLTAELTLDRQLCLAVYRASHAFTAAYRPLLEPFGLTYPQYVVLLALSERGSMTVSELGVVLDLDSGTLSPLLRRLERADWVSRTRSAPDGRIVVIELTPTGQDMKSKLSSVPTQIGRCAGLRSGLSEELIIQLNDVTRSLRAGPVS